MDIIAHTASLHNTKESLINLRDNDLYTKLELDFILTEDYIPVWSHNNRVSSKLINKSRYSDLKHMTLEHVLDVLNGEKELLNEIKHYNKNDIDLVLRAFSILKHWDKNVQIESFNWNLIRNF